MKTLRSMRVHTVIRERDRVLLYGDPAYPQGYHVIAETDCMAQPGETILYEPYGLNFGFFAGYRERTEDEAE